MKKCFILSLAAAVLSVANISAQKTSSRPAPQKTISKPVPAPKAERITDTFACNIQAAMRKLNAMATDPKRTALSAASGFKEVNTSSYTVYNAALAIPTAAENLLTQQAVDWSKGTVQWDWSSVLIRSPKNEIPASAVYAFRDRADSIVKAMALPMVTDSKNGIVSAAVWENVSDEKYRYLYKADEVTLHVYFVKPVMHTQQQAIDSIVLLYRPGFNDMGTAEDASEKFCRSLNAESIPKETKKLVFANELTFIANKDLKAAYQMLMGGDYDVNVPGVMSGLSDAQRAKISEYAKAQVSAFYDKKDFDIRTYTTPPPPLNTSTTANTYSKGYTQSTPQPQGKRIKCPRCNGAGQCEFTDYKHTYDGIYKTVDTRVSHYGTCPNCNGVGWVTVYKKN